jgi:hypothetical protein
MHASEKTWSWRAIFLVGIALAMVVVYLRMPEPCWQPLTYRLGHIDERFGLTRWEFSMAVQKAAAIWGQPLSRELFRNDPQGAIEISLIYDYRQETADKLKKLNYKIDYTKHSHDIMKLRLESLRSEYERKRSVLDSDLNTFKARLNARNAEIEAWNRQGGAPENVRNRLMSGKSELNSELERLHIRQDEAKRMVDEINSLVLVMNEIATVQNLDVVRYRDVGSLLGGEFLEGYFENKKGDQSIKIYHYNDDTKLVRLLVHELGHALGLGHSDNPDAVMYRLNQSDKLELTADDIATLKARCKAK